MKLIVKTALVIGAACVALALPRTAHASVILDFGNSGVYGAADGFETYNLTDLGINQTFVATVTVGNPLLSQTADGFGVQERRISDDEIGLLEGFSDTFAAPITITAIRLSNLFSNDGLAGLYKEQGYYTVNGGATWVLFTANSTTGDLVLNVNLTNVSTIAFRSGGDLRDDFSVRSLTVEAVPEPATLVLLGTGLAAAASRRRRRAA